MTFPPDFILPEQKIKIACLAAKTIACLASSNRNVVQAGGCAGLWPLALSRYFDHVYTFEPAPSNISYLRQNTAHVSAISVYEYALGDVSGRVGLTRPKERAGLWYVDGDGDIPMVTLDEMFGKMPVDAIVLDVEGYEPQVLRGARRLIETHQPLLWFEFLRNPGEIATLVETYGYTSPCRAIGNDFYSVYGSLETSRARREDFTTKGQQHGERSHE